MTVTVTVTEEFRAPCPRCGESVPEAGSRCAHCGAVLLVDLLAARPTADERTAYAIARELKQQWPELDFLPVKQGLATATVPIATAVTRLRARELAERLAEHGVPTGTTPHDTATSPVAAALQTLRRRPLLPVGVAALAAIVAFLIVARDGDDDGDPIPARRLAGSSLPAPSIREVADRALPALVSLRCATSSGTGFLVSDELVVTNAHVLCDRGRTPVEVVFANGRETGGRTARQDERLDLALVRLDERVRSVTPLALGDATTLQRGDEVLIFGNPLGLDFTLGRGLVSHDARNLMGVLYIQVDANINPGNSGGPLFDAAGRAVGIVSMTVGETTGLGLALPVNYLYEAEPPYLPRPPGADSAVWRERLARAAAEDRRAASEITEIYEQPVLAQALMYPTHQGPAGVTALVVRRFPGVPSSEKYYFSFHERRGDRLLCSALGEATQWRPLRLEEIDGLDERTHEWASGHGVLQELHVGEVQVQLDRCPDARELVGSELWLEDGDAETQRIEVTALSMPLPLGRGGAARR